MASRKPKMLRDIARAKDVIEYENRIKTLTLDVYALEEKICHYMETACAYKGESEDLRVRCEEVEEMLRQTESRLEIEYTAHTEQIKLVKELEEKSKQKDDYIEKLKSDLAKERIMKEQQESMRKLYNGGLEKCIEENKRLKLNLAEAEQAYDFWQGEYEKEVNKCWWKKVFNIG